MEKFVCYWKIHFSQSYGIWDKTAILFPSDDFRLTYSRYGNIQFPQYVYQHKDWISNEILNTHAWCDCIKIFKQINEYIPNIQPGMLFVDIGANIGSCSLLASAFNFSIIAFEPLPTNLHLFTRSLLANPSFLPSTTLYPIALGNAETTVSMRIRYDNVGGSAIVQKRATNERESLYSAKSTTLSNIFKDFNGTIMYMKLDVEGYEPFVIEGGEDLFKNHQVKILFYERSCQALNENPDVYRKMDEIFQKYNYTSSRTACTSRQHLFNVLVISNEYMEANNFDFDKLRNSFW